MESPSAGSWLSSTRLYMIIRASAGYGWVTPCVRPISAVIAKQASSVMLEGEIFGSVVLILLCSVRSIWRQTQCPNYLCTPTLIRKCMDSLMCVIKSLFVVTLLHICHSVAENGGSVLWQHHWAAEDWTRVLPNGLLRQEVSFLPQGKAYQIQSHLVCPDTVMILLMRSAALLSQLETMSAAVACVGQKAGMLMLILRMRLKSMNISTFSQRVKLNPFLLQFLITCMLFTV